MLQKSLRLGGRESFESIFRSKKAIFGSEIALFFRFGSDHPARIGFAFKQKSFPRAVTRHFLKRKGSAIMRELHGTLPFGADIIVLFQRPFVGAATYQGIRESLEVLIERLNKEKK
ncbi:MAG: ribonuclease P protein component [Undibacterium sp.]